MCAPCNILLGHIFFFFAFLWLYQEIYQEIWFFCNLVDTIGICFFYENDFVSRSLECISQTLELTSQTLGYIFQTLQYKNAKQRNNCFLFEKEKKNLSFPFAFCSLIRTFSLCEKVLSLERTKKIKFSFGSLLAYSYLSPLVKIGCISEIKTKNFVFCFVFRSICTIFAGHND